MKIAIGADHAGFSLKEQLRQMLAGEGYEVVDFGTDSLESCDYPDFAGAVGRDVAQGKSDRGILVCSTGIGMAMAANKVDGVRAAPAESGPPPGKPATTAGSPLRAVWSNVSAGAPRPGTSRTAMSSRGSR